MHKNYLKILFYISSLFDVFAVRFNITCKPLSRKAASNKKIHVSQKNASIEYEKLIKHKKSFLSRDESKKTHRET